MEHFNIMYLLLKSLCRESGNIKKALKHLQENEEKICDKVQFMELSGTYQLLLENYSEALSIYEELIKRNQENSSYFEHFLIAKQFNQVK